MSVRKDKKGMWRYRKMVRLPSGVRERIFGTPTINTKLEAEREERAHIERLLNPTMASQKKEVPTFEEWFNGRFWNEWVIGRKNKPSEVESKRGIYDFHLSAAFGKSPLNAIDDSAIAQFRAMLVKRKLSDKRINNILAVLSKSLNYAARVRLIEHAPEMGLFKIERPEIESWSFEEYARLLHAARLDREPEWYVATCLAGEAGLRPRSARSSGKRTSISSPAR